MKSVSKLAIAAFVAVSSMFTIATAYADEEPDIFNFVSPQCSQPATKEAHPSWYNVGGYCNPYDYTAN